MTNVITVWPQSVKHPELVVVFAQSVLREINTRIIEWSEK